jgi:hypothetical protein
MNLLRWSEEAREIASCAAKASPLLGDHLECIWELVLINCPLWFLQIVARQENESRIAVSKLILCQCKGGRIHFFGGRFQFVRPSSTVLVEIFENKLCKNTSIKGKTILNSSACKNYFLLYWVKFDFQPSIFIITGGSMELSMLQEYKRDLASGLLA